MPVDLMLAGRCATTAITLLIGFFSCDMALSQENEKSQTEQLEQVTVEDVVADDQITDRLESIFTSTEWFKDLTVESENGVVTIDGASDTDEHRVWAERLANRTEDVVAVINKLEVEKVVDISGSASVVSKSLHEMWKDFLARSPLFLAAILALFVTWIAAKAVGYTIRRLLTNRRIRSGLKDLIYQLSSIAVWVAGLMLAAIIAFPGMTPSKVLAVLGLGSVAIGFAFKDIFENFFAGVLILWRYPIARGDIITCGDITGKVQEITIRNTMIRRLDGELTLVPNARLFKSSVDILTNPESRRIQLICGVAYSEDIDTARSEIEKAVRQCDTVEQNEPVEVFAQEFADSSINFEICWWAGSRPVEIRASRDQVVCSIKRALDAADIEIPFPYRTLTFQDSSFTKKLESQFD